MRSLERARWVSAVESYFRQERMRQAVQEHISRAGIAWAALPANRFIQCRYPSKSRSLGAIWSRHSRATAQSKRASSNWMKIPSQIARSPAASRRQREIGAPRTASCTSSSSPSADVGAASNRVKPYRQRHLAQPMYGDDILDGGGDPSRRPLPPTPHAAAFGRRA